MNTQTTQKVNSFDTLHLTIPGDIINRNKSNFNQSFRVNEETMELLDEKYEGLTQIHFSKDKTHLGLGHCTYVPHREIYDIKISAKILRDKYPIGITKETIYNVIDTLEEYGIGDIEKEAFVKYAEIRTCDNTFNIPVDNFINQQTIYETFESLSAISVQGVKQKMNTFEADGSKNGDINGVVFGKNTRKNQSITFYYKVDEAFCNPEDKRENAKEVIMRKYGMDYRDFFQYFDDKIRAELRLTSQELIKKSFNLRKGTRDNVVLHDILESKSNAMLKKFNEYVSHKQSEIQMKRLERNKMLKDKYTISPKIDKKEVSIILWGNMLNDIIESTNGNYKIVSDYVKKQIYGDSTHVISDTIKETIHTLITIHNTKGKSNKEVGAYINRYREITKKIKQLV